ICQAYVINWNWNGQASFIRIQCYQWRHGEYSWLAILISAKWSDKVLTTDPGLLGTKRPEVNSSVIVILKYIAYEYDIYIGIHEATCSRGEFSSSLWRNT